MRWRWDWARDIRELVFALDPDSTGQRQWRQLARQVALRGKRVAVLEPAAYGGHKDVSAAWAAGVLCGEERPEAARQHAECLEMPEEVREACAERAAIMMADGARTVCRRRAPGVGVASGLGRRAVRCVPRRRHARPPAQPAARRSMAPRGLVLGLDRRPRLG